VKSLVADRLSLLVECISGILVAFILGLALSWQLGIVLIGLQPLLVVCFYTRKVLLQTISRKSAKAQDEGSQVASECFTHHSTIAAFCSQDKVIQLFDSTQASPHKEIKKQSWYAGVALGTSQFIALCYVPFVYWYAGKLMRRGVVDFSVFLLSYFIFIRTGRMIADAGSMTSDLAKGSEAIKSVFEIMGRNSFIDPDNEGVSCEEIRGSVEVKHVEFAYPARPDAIILTDFCLKINARSNFALVGRSGCGKSTIIGLIERFYDPLDGKVLIDGKDIRSFNLRSLRKHIALVGQEPTLFAGTIRENIAYGKDNATEAEIVEAAKAANAHEFIS
jgi:ATP-binding cassette subfamily B (MDR/TAP) protein 1